MIKILQKKYILLIVLVSTITCLLNGQVLLNTNTYTQTFGSSGTNDVANGNWVNNSAVAGQGFLGWYINDATQYKEYVDMDAGTSRGNALPGVNGGGFYMYTILGSTNLKFGTRPSDGSTVNGPCAGLTCPYATIAAAITKANYYGVRIQNQLSPSTTIKCITVSFDWYQLTVAEDYSTTLSGQVINTNYVDYLQGATENNLAAAGPWTYITSFTATDDTALCCTATERIVYGTIGGHIGPISVPVTIPHGQEIMIRFIDPDNDEDDHHLAIDNFTVNVYTDVACTQALPIKLISFTGNYNPKNYSVELNWATATEINCKEFEIEKTDGDGTWHSVVTVAAAGNSETNRYYSAIDPEPFQGSSYYRLKETDFDGNFSYSGTQPVDVDPELNSIAIAPNPSRNLSTISFGSATCSIAILTILDAMGHIVETKQINALLGTNTLQLDVSGYGNGLYFVLINNGIHQYYSKLIVNHN
jgi:hypothetical protein